MQWFRHVSHPYAIVGADKGRPSHMTQRLCDILDDVHVSRKTESSSSVRVSPRWL